VAGPDHRLAPLSESHILNLATGDANEPVQVVPVVAENVQFVRLNIWSNWGAGGIVGLSEVRFAVSTPEPPPSHMIILPLGVTASSYYPAWGEPTALIDNSGLSGAGRLATHNPANNVQYILWHSDGVSAVASQWLEFDLGAAYNVTNALIWQLAQFNLTARGVQSFSLEVAGTDHNFTSYSTGNTLIQAGGVSEEPVQVVPLVADKIRYIKLIIHSNFGNQYVGLSEVQFEVATHEMTTADATLAPVGVSASTTYTAGGTTTGYAAQLAINGSGLTGTGRAATHSNANMQQLFWHSDLNVTTSDQWIEFDLGLPYDLTNLLLWQGAHAGFTKYGIREFSIDIAGVDHVFTTYSTGNMLNCASTELEQLARVIPLAAGGIRYVRLDIQSNCGAPDGAVALSEVRFEAAPLVPEANALLRSPVAVEVSSTHYENDKQHLIDGSCMSGTGLDATHTNGLGFATMWLSSNAVGVANEWIEFDLGGELELIAAAVWQYNQTTTSAGNPLDYTDRGVRSMTISIAGSDKSYTEYGTVSLDRAQRYDTEPAQLLNLRARGVRYVKFAVNSNWGASGNRVGLSEVQFLYKRTGSLIMIQ